MTYFLMVLWIGGVPIYSNFTSNRELFHDMDECQQAAHLANENRKHAGVEGRFRCSEVRFLDLG